MLTGITLDGLRCFAETTTVTFGALTVIAGANSTGKSSVLHALLAMVQSEQRPSEGHLRLSGEWVEIGSFRQSLNYSRPGERRFSIGVAGTVGDVETDVLMTLGEPTDAGATTARIERIEACVDDTEMVFERSDAGRGLSHYDWLKRDEASSEWRKSGGAGGPAFPWTLSLRGLYPDMSTEVGRLTPCGPDTVLYLSAFRDLPRNFYPRRGSELGPLLGTMGEHVAETLFSRRNETVDILPDNGPPLLLGEGLEKWWSHIFGGEYAIRAETAEALRFKLSLDTPSAESLYLTQVGTGLSQALPVIVLGLCSKPGDLVIVEAPEVQLHPAAQHRLMDLFAALASSGRQVVLETHSDHIIHAAQLAVRHKKLSPGAVALRFFSQVDGDARVENIPVDEHGGIQKQPPGFVDQASEDLLELIR